MFSKIFSKLLAIRFSKEGVYENLILSYTKNIPIKFYLLFINIKLDRVSINKTYK